MNLTEYKYIYFWEYLHRILGRIIGLLFLLPFLFYYFKGYLNKKITKQIIISILLVVSQGLLGWYMVKSGLIDKPHVSHFRLTAHLLLAFLLLGYVYWIKLSIEFPNQISLYKNENLKHINIIIGIFIIQIIFGAFIAGTKAGKLWNTFPLINGEFFPSYLLSYKPFYLNFINNMMMFQFTHRIIGVLLIVYGIWFYFKTSDEIYGKYSRLLFMFILIQFYIGVITLLSRVQIELGVLHQFMAIMLCIILIRIKHSICYTNIVK